ncbi:hypothetical protein J1N35_033763 [Gossypium stocksii]|uniref:Uncharacterized protein n=1 Tax=Gossypium stocksii TaxID=47602 RepID=A0A9D3UQP4_9ROSI|nr:hypothetical protein J1N35_033763 [Gossypium stocksii]
MLSLLPAPAHACQCTSPVARLTLLPTARASADVKAMRFGGSVLQQQVEERKDPEEEDPIKIEPIQLAKIIDKVELVEPVTVLDMTTSMFRTQSPRLDLRDELSKLMDMMQHMQWQQQAY